MIAVGRSYTRNPHGDILTNCSAKQDCRKNRGQYFGESCSLDPCGRKQEQCGLVTEIGVFFRAIRSVNFHWRVYSIKARILLDYFQRVRSFEQTVRKETGEARYMLQ